MTISDVIMILAVAVAPFLAVFAQTKINERKEKRNNRLWIFRTLMATRGNKLSMDHVQALNLIELVFDNVKKEKMIIEKWNEYLDHLFKPQEENVELQKTWSEKADDFLAELLYEMGKTLGFNFDKVKIKRGIYSPKGHGEEWIDNLQIRKGLCNILTGKDGFPVKQFNKE
jgi:hypothetical protein